MGIYFKGTVFQKKKYNLEADFEDMIFKNSTLFFGEDTILIPKKTKISGSSLGNTIPDGFLFDFSDMNDIKFFLIEVELSKHSFYGHIFPQITKFFSFLRTNDLNQIGLVEEMYKIISNDENLLMRFKEKIKDEDLYKMLKDTIENSQDILILIDQDLPEFRDIQETYTDTWDKYVTILKIEEYVNDKDSIYSITPDFKVLSETEAVFIQDENSIGAKKYTEEFHMEDKTELVKKTYHKIRDSLSEFTFNYQRHYISIRNSRNFAFLRCRKKFIRLVIMLPEDEVKKIVTNYELQTPSISVQNFYHGPCTYIHIKSLDHIDEVCQVLRVASGKIEKKSA